MNTESTKEAQARKSGIIQSAEVDKAQQPSDSRKAKTFVPEQENVSPDIPESITAGERLPHVSEYSGIHLERLPIKGLKSFAYGLVVLIVITMGWEVWTVFRSILEVHWMLAGGFVLLFSVVIGLGIRLVQGYLSDNENAEVLADIRKQSARLLEGHDHGQAKVLIKTLTTFYVNKPQQVYFQRCIDSLPDYCDDREVIEHIDRVFLQPLDDEVLRRVSKFSSQTGVAVAASPWPSLDMVLALWRSVTMIDEISQVYGLRPSLSNRYKLIKSVINQLALIGATEVILDQMMEEFGVSTLSGMASVRMGQGVGAGVYSAKIGLAAMSVTRPIEFVEQKRPRLKSLLSSIILSIKEMVMR